MKHREVKQFALGHKVISFTSMYSQNSVSRASSPNNSQNFGWLKQYELLSLVQLQSNSTNSQKQRSNHFA